MKCDDADYIKLHEELTQLKVKEKTEYCASEMCPKCGNTVFNIAYEEVNYGFPGNIIFKCNGCGYYGRDYELV